MSTTKETLDLRPVRLAWNGPREFSISGTDSGHRPKRIVLRFSTPEAARSLATIIPDLGQPVEVASSPLVEEIPLFVRFFYSQVAIGLSIAAIILWAALLAGAVLSYGFIGIIIAAWVLSIMTPALLPVISVFTTPFNGALRLEGN